MSEIDHVKGCLLGLAVGDALGTTLEFETRDKHPQLTEMVGGGPFDFRPGTWTDDTSMALCLAESLLATGTFDARDLMNRFVRWWQQGENSVTGKCFDIGITTSSALCQFLGTNEPLSGDTDPYSAGNGSLMRLAPVPMFFRNDMEKAREISNLQSKTTHGAQEAIEACEIFTTLLIQAIAGSPKFDILRSREWKGCDAVRDIASRSWESKERGEIQSSGYVIHSLEAALWCVDRSKTFEEALILAVNLADDADTVGAITGQLAGALWGVDAIPHRWISKLAWRDEIEILVERLYCASRQ